MSASPIRLATENGKRIGRTSKAKRLAAEPATEAARLRRCLASIRREAENAHRRAIETEKLWEAVFRVSCGDDVTITRAMVRHAIIEGAHSHRCALVVRYCEMAEEGTLCA